MLGCQVPEKDKDLQHPLTEYVIWLIVSLMRMHELSQLTKGRLGLHSLTPPRSKDMSVIVCPYCTDGEAFCAPSDQLLEQHIRFAHLQDPGFSIECKNASCSCVFTSLIRMQ